MKPLMWSALVVMILCGASCTKNTISPARQESIPSQIITPKTDAEPPVLTATIAGATLQIELQSKVTCYSYRQGEMPLPCSITALMNGRLSKPLDGFLQIELEKTNIVEAEQPGPRNDAEPGTGSHFVATIAPNTTTFSIDTGIPTMNNNQIPEGQFKLVSVSVFRRVD